VTDRQSVRDGLSDRKWLMCALGGDRVMDFSFIRFLWSVFSTLDTHANAEPM